MEYEIYKNFTSDLRAVQAASPQTAHAGRLWPSSPGCRQRPDSGTPGHLQIHQGTEGWLGLSGLPVSLGVLYTHMYTEILIALAVKKAQDGSFALLLSKSSWVPVLTVNMLLEHSKASPRGPHYMTRHHIVTLAVRGPVELFGITHQLLRTLCCLKK